MVVTGPLKRQAVIRLVRARIADGTLRPGGAVPSAAALSRETGCSPLTARTAVRTLVAEGTLVPGVSPNGRARVAQPRGSGSGAEALSSALSRTLAARRADAEMTQVELADKLAMSVTTVGHAETGRTWQSRDFWRRADLLLGGGLLEMYDKYAVARFAALDAGGGEPEAPPPSAVAVLPASVTITPDGVAIVWPDGTEALARPPGRPA